MFCEHKKPPPLPPLPTRDQLEAAVESLVNDINETNETTLCRQKPLHPKASPWWNMACATAIQVLCQAQDPNAKQTAQHRLKGSVKFSKCEWAKEHIQKEQLWEVVSWIHSRCLSKVPLLQGAKGLVHSHEEIANILSQHFFPNSPPKVSMHFTDDPPPCPTQQLPSFRKEDISALLQKTANHSTPGPSGHTCTILKWTWEADEEWMATLIEGCV